MSESLPLARYTLTGPASASVFVLIHGAGMSGAYFAPLAKALSTRYRVMNIDMPGFGRCPGKGSALTIAELAVSVRITMVRAGVSRPVLAGQSMGCQVVAEILRQDAGAGRAAILMGPTVNAAERTIGRQLWRLLEDYTRESWRVNATLLRAFLQCGLWQYWRTVRYMMDDALEAKIGDITVPVLVLRGVRDPISRRAWCDELMQRAPHAVLREIPDAPHVFHYEWADETARYCREFLAGVPPNSLKRLE